MHHVILTLALTILSLPVLAQPKIVWFSTLQADLSEKSGFWKRVHDLVGATGEDLDLDFEIYYSEENYIKLMEQVDTVLSNPATRPDGIIFHNYKRTGEKILAVAERYKVKSLIFNAGFTATKNPNLRPRTRYKHWVGEVLPDDEYAGAELFKQLDRAARSLPDHQPNNLLQVLAMEGNKSSAAYQARKRGFVKALEQSKNTVFTQYVPADWSRTVAQEKFPVLLKRYPKIKLMWAANDNMALGLIDGARDHSSVPGRNFVVGGIDWLPESFEAVREGKMAVTIGGHFVEGMWALILLYDYLNGFDFSEQYGHSLSTQMLAVTKDELDKYGDITSKLDLDNLRQFDFKALTKTHNVPAHTYQFNIAHLLSNL